MPHDSVVNLRQIGGYPQKPAADARDLILVQQGGLGGPYYATTPLGLLAPLATAQLAVGLSLPDDVGRSNLAAQAHVLPLGGEVLWNAYRASSGQYRSWHDGLAARLIFGPATRGLQFGMAPQQIPGTAIAAFIPALSIDPAGDMRVAGTLRVGRDPGGADEVATLGFLTRRAVTSVNGRHGAVRLGRGDINAALGLALGDEVASLGAVDWALKELLANSPFCFTWNGRLGNVFLQLDDIERVYFTPGTRPQAPTAPTNDSSRQIANTEWVTRYLTDKWWVDIVHTFAPIASPDFVGKPLAPLPDLASDDNQIATTAWVREVLGDIAAGVLQWNGRSGFVFLQLDDVNSVFTAAGAIPLAPTAAPGTNTQQIATTAFVTGNTVWSWNTRKGDVTLLLSDILGASGQQQTALGATPPATPSNGQFYFDPTTKRLEIWNGAAWDVAGGAVEISDTQPATEYPGKLWWSSATGNLFIWYEGPSGGQWVTAAANQGSPGPPGVKGDQGLQGLPGPALNPQGTVPSGAPGSLPAIGNPGDFWIDASTNQSWAWNSNTNSWVGLGAIGSPFPDAPNDGPLYARQAQGGPGGPVDWTPVIDDGVY